MGIDISERKAAELALQKSEHALAHTGKTVAAAPKAAKPASTKPTVRAKPAVKAKAVSTGA